MSETELAARQAAFNLGKKLRGDAPAPVSGQEQPFDKAIQALRLKIFDQFNPDWHAGDPSQKWVGVDPEAHGQNYWQGTAPQQYLNEHFFNQYKPKVDELYDK